MAQLCELSNKFIGEREKMRQNAENNTKTTTIKAITLCH